MALYYLKRGKCGWTFLNLPQVQVGELLSSGELYPYMEKNLLTTDFDEIILSGYCLIQKGQSMLNKPDIPDNFWIIKSIIVRTQYQLVEVINLKGDRAIRTRNAGIWGTWIYD